MVEEAAPEQVDEPMPDAEPEADAPELEEEEAVEEDIPPAS